MRFTTEIVESKNRIFVHLDRVNKNTVAIEAEIRKKLIERGMKPGALIVHTPDLIVYEFMNMVDLTTSYGASSLEVAPSSITDPAPESKPKAPRRRRTRKTTPKTAK